MQGCHLGSIVLWYIRSAHSSSDPEILWPVEKPFPVPLYPWYRYSPSRTLVFEDDPTKLNSNKPVKMVVRH